MKREFINARMKVWESPFIPSHLTFKNFKFTHFQSINHTTIKQTIESIYLFITFQNLEFWDVTEVERAGLLGAPKGGVLLPVGVGFPIP